MPLCCQGIIYSFFIDKLLETRALSDYYELVHTPCQTEIEKWNRLDNKNISSYWNLTAN